jgi:predicted amidohydrolase
VECVPRVSGDSWKVTGEKRAVFCAVGDTPEEAFRIAADRIQKFRTRHPDVIVYPTYNTVYYPDESVTHQVLLTFLYF